MERPDLSLNLTRDFDAWKAGKATIADVAEMNTLIKFATDNGIDLVVKIPESVLYKPGFERPMLKEDAKYFSTGTEGDFLVFNISSERNRQNTGKRRLELKVMPKYRNWEPCLLLKDRDNDAIAAFLPDEVTSIGLK